MKNYENFAPCHENILRSSPDFQYRVKNCKIFYIFLSRQILMNMKMKTNTLTKAVRDEPTTVFHLLMSLVFPFSHQYLKKN